MRSHFLRARRRVLTYVGGASGSNTAGDATYAVSLTSISLMSGDLIVVGIGCTTISDRAISTPSGFTELFDLYANDNLDANLAVSYKVSDGTETSITVTGAGAADYGAVSVVHVWRGVDQATPIDVTSTTATITNTGVPDPPSITPITRGAVILGFGYATAGTTLTAPSGTSNSVGLRALATNGSGFGIVCSHTAWTSGAYDMGNFGGSTTNTNSCCAAAVALRPA